MSRDEGMEKADVEKELALVSEGEENEDEDEDILADCINIGMQNSRLAGCFLVASTHPVVTLFSLILNFCLCSLGANKP